MAILLVSNTSVLGSAANAPLRICCTSDAALKTLTFDNRHSTFKTMESVEATFLLRFAVGQRRQTKLSELEVSIAGAVVH
jgi:hypothetical protein